tara:strand:- start:645 stop:1346 length:702 start_codon:yes stop_codon:yes gene_type:complete
MNFKIDPAILEKFPDLNIGIVLAKNINNLGQNEELLEILKQQQATIKENFNTETLAENPKIDTWRKAYSAFGAKPKKYKCSVENLYRMILNDIELTHINTLVDIYNYISLKHIIPVGGDDLEKIDGNITLTIAKGDQPFTELNSDETKSPKEGEVIYRDDKEVLCRRWNWRECDKSKMTEQINTAALVIEGLSAFSKEEIQTITSELADLIQKYCKAETEIFILNKDNPETEL